MTRITVTMACLLLVALSACSSEPETVLQSDLPQIPGLVPRDSTGLLQQGDRVIGGQFSYKGPIPNLSDRVATTMSRFELAGWKLSSQTLTGATAVLVYRKDNRTARIEIIRNGVQPLMSTAILRVESTGEAIPPATPESDTQDAPTPSVTGESK